jgi:hypothetical protein
VAVGTHLFTLALASFPALGQPVVVESAHVTLRPLGPDASAQPFWCDRGEDIQGVAHALADQLQAVQAAHYGQDAGGVGALIASGLDQSHPAEALQQVVEKEPLGVALQQAGAELAEYGGVKA